MNHIPEKAVAAVILAGGGCSSEFAAAAGLAPHQSRGVARLAGRTLLEWLLHALRSCPAIGSVTLVATDDPALPSDVDYRAAPGDGLMESIENGSAAGSREPWVLLITADLPLVTPAGLDHFIGETMDRDLDLGYVAVSRDDYQRDYPELRRTWLRTPDGPFTGGNTALIRRSAIPALRKVANDAFARRKNPMALVTLIGLGRLLLLMAGRLTLKQIGQAVTRVIGIRAELVISPHGGLAADLDHPGDLQAAEVYLNESRQASREGTVQPEGCGHNLSTAALDQPDPARNGDDDGDGEKRSAHDDSEAPQSH